MKPSIAITLIIVIAAFSYVSGYSISSHNKRKAAYSNMAKVSVNQAVAPTSAPAPGYGEPAPGYGGGSTPGYGSPAPGYGQ